MSVFLLLIYEKWSFIKNVHELFCKFFVNWSRCGTEEGLDKLRTTQRQYFWYKQLHQCQESHLRLLLIDEDTVNDQHLCQLLATTSFTLARHLNLITLLTKRWRSRLRLSIHIIIGYKWKILIKIRQ